MAHSVTSNNTLRTSNYDSTTSQLQRMIRNRSLPRDNSIFPALLIRILSQGAGWLKALRAAAMVCVFQSNRHMPVCGDPLSDSPSTHDLMYQFIEHSIGNNQHSIGIIEHSIGNNVCYTAWGHACVLFVVLFHIVDRAAASSSVEGDKSPSLTGKYVRKTCLFNDTRSSRGQIVRRTAANQPGCPST